MIVYTAEEVAGKLKVEYKTVLRLIQRGLLKTLPGIRHKRITEAELNRYLGVQDILASAGRMFRLSTGASVNNGQIVVSPNGEGRGDTQRVSKAKSKTMKLTVTVISDRPDEYVGKRGLVKSQIITCQDVDPSGYPRYWPLDRWQKASQMFYAPAEDATLFHANSICPKTDPASLPGMVSFSALAGHFSGRLGPIDSCRKFLHQHLALECALARRRRAV